MKGEDAENQQICGSQHLLFFFNDGVYQNRSLLDMIKTNIKNVSARTLSAFIIYLFCYLEAGKGTAK